MSNIQQILHELNFDEKWFDLEFVSPEKLYELWTDFQIGEDTNKEFYRLGEADADIYGMGMSTRIGILNRKEFLFD